MRCKIKRDPGQIAIVLTEEEAISLGIPPVCLEVELTPAASGLVVSPEDPREDQIDEIFDSIDPSTLHDVVDWGAPRGREAW